MLRHIHFHIPIDLFLFLYNFVMEGNESDAYTFTPVSSTPRKPPTRGPQTTKPTGVVTPKPGQS